MKFKRRKKKQFETKITGIDISTSATEEQIYVDEQVAVSNPSSKSLILFIFIDNDQRSNLLSFNLVLVCYINESSAKCLFHYTYIQPTQYTHDKHYASSDESGEHEWNFH